MVYLKVSFIDKRSFFYLVCPTGFDWFDQQGCAMLITTPASKSAAQQVCRGLNPASNLMMPKTAQTALQMQQVHRNMMKPRAHNSKKVI